MTATESGNETGRDADSNPGDQGERNQPDPGRSQAEWVSLSLSLLIVLGLLGTIIYLYLTGPAHEVIVAVDLHSDQVRLEGRDYYLPVTIRNAGGATGEAVRVEITLMPQGAIGPSDEEVSEVEIQFLEPASTTEATVVFSSDPREGELSTNVLSFHTP